MCTSDIPPAPEVKYMQADFCVCDREIHVSPRKLTCFQYKCFFLGQEKIEEAQVLRRAAL